MGQTALAQSNSVHATRPGVALERARRHGTHLMGPWSPLWRHEFQMLSSVMLLPPPNASLRLMAARGMLKTTLPSARVMVARLVNQSDDCSWYWPISCALL